MSKNPIARLRQELEETASTRRAETFDMINIRPGSKIAAMIELLAELRGVPVSSMLTDDLSERLALYAASDRRHVPAILDAAETSLKEHHAISSDSALGRLVAQGLLKVETDNPLISHVPLFEFLSGKKGAGSDAQEDKT